MSSSLYAQLPQTAETQLAAKMSDLQSEVKKHIHLLTLEIVGIHENVNRWSICLCVCFIPE